MTDRTTIETELQKVTEGDLIRWNGRKYPQPVRSATDTDRIDFEVTSWTGSRFRFFLDNGTPTLRNLQSGNTYTITEFENVGELHDSTHIE